MSVNTSTDGRQMSRISSASNANMWDPNSISLSYFESWSKNRLNLVENNNNASVIIGNRSDANTRLAPHRTPPLRQIIQMPDALKYSFTLQQEKEERVRGNNNSTINSSKLSQNSSVNKTTDLSRTSNASISWALKRNPSPTPPLRTIDTFSSKSQSATERPYTASIIQPAAKSAFISTTKKEEQEQKENQIPARRQKIAKQGLIVPVKANETEKKKSILQTTSAGTATSSIATKSKSALERIEALARDSLSNNRGKIAIPSTLPTQLNPTVENPVKLSAHELQRPNPEPFFPAAQLSSILLPEPVQVESIVNAMSSNIQPYRKSGSNTLKKEFLRSSHIQPQDVHKLSDEVLIAKWLESIGVQLQSIFSLESPICLEFCDGLLLCKIVSILQHREVEGITQNPKRTASYLHNIRKALEVLRQKKNMPIDYLWSEQDILRGDSKVITGLLLQIRKAYGHHYK